MRRSEAGYSLVAVAASIAIMTIMMGVAAPTWRYVMQDMREEELIFRGGQIADAIDRYQKKNGNAPPVSLEVLVKGKYLRKAYKDPMTEKGVWRFVRPGEAVGMAIQPPGVGGGPPGTRDPAGPRRRRPWAAHPPRRVLPGRGPRPVHRRGQHEPGQEPARVQRPHPVRPVDVRRRAAPRGRQGHEPAYRARASAASGRATIPRPFAEIAPEP